MISVGPVEPTLRLIVQQLLRAGHPQKIILFGSQARGQASTESDYDRRVVENSSVPHHSRALSSSIKRFRSLQRPLREGQVLYEK